MEKFSLKVCGLGKQYRIGGKKKSYNTLCDSLMETVAMPFRRAKKLLSGQASGASDLDEVFWALRDVSLEVKQGEVLGLIGPNGAGKSTFLKLLSRVTAPTEGQIEINGRVGCLLEVGTGFHPELTGRENTYLNGAILGMQKAEIAGKFDEIVEFAGVAKFIDTPVKHYSSGMYLRLAFAVAAHLDPEILLVDEVLAVGDSVFQKKCLGKMGDVAKQGRTVVLVSHNMGAIARLCHSAVWIDKGRLVKKGPAQEVISQYLHSNASTESTWERPDHHPKTKRMNFLSVRILDEHRCPIRFVEYSKPFYVEIVYWVPAPTNGCTIGISLQNSEGLNIMVSCERDTTEWEGRNRETGVFTSICEIPGNFLRPGNYYLGIGSYQESVEWIERFEDVVGFEVSGIGLTSRSARYGVIAPRCQWTVDFQSDDSKCNKNLLGV
jgi:lipopolysaccharide transport system ATP-binding protein